MTNPFTSGSAPGRAQPADRRPGSFKLGHEKRGGRKSGAPNLLTIDFKRGLFEAAYRIGQDGNGKNGIVGFSRGSPNVTRGSTVACCSLTYS
jgi:hypothetical protein